MPTDVLGYNYDNVAQWISRETQRLLHLYRSESLCIVAVL